MTPSRPLAYAYVPDDPEVKKIAERRIAVVKRLTDAAFDFLTFNDQLTIDTFGCAPPRTTNPFGFTVESLMNVTKQRDMIADQIETVETALAKQPRTAKPGQDAIMAMMEVSVLTPLKMQLEAYNAQISKIQEALEGDVLTGGSSDEQKGG